MSNINSYNKEKKIQILKEQIPAEHSSQIILFKVFFMIVFWTWLMIQYDMKYTFKRIICEECSAGICSFSIYIFFSSLQQLILDMLTLHIKVNHYVIFFHPFVCILHLPSKSLSLISFPITLFLLTYVCVFHVILDKFVFI